MGAGTGTGWGRDRWRPCRAQPRRPGLSFLTAGRGFLAVPDIVLVAQSMAFRWESSVGVSSFPTNWRVEPRPLSPQGIGTLARAGLPGKFGNLFVGLLDPPRGWNPESELRTHPLLSETHTPAFPSDLLCDTGWPSGPLFACLCNGRVASFGDDKDIIRILRFQS